MKKVFTVAVIAFLSLNACGTEKIVGKWQLSKDGEVAPDTLIINSDNTCTWSKDFYDGNVESTSEYFKITFKSEKNEDDDFGTIKMTAFFFVDKECNYLYFGHNAFKTKDSEKRIKLTRVQ